MRRGTPGGSSLDRIEPLTPTLALDLVGVPRIKNATYATLNLSLSWRFR